MDFIIQGSYFIAAVLFIIGLKQMASPARARRGIIWAGVGMLLATVVTFFHPEVKHNTGWILLAMALSGGMAWWTGKKVAMTDMPQMIAIYNGMGGGAAAAIAAVELVKYEAMPKTVQIMAVTGALIGTIAFSGSGVAFAKLQGLIRKNFHMSNQQLINLALFLVTVALGAWVALSGTSYSGFSLLLFFVLAFVFGILMTLPIGGADMPVVISLFNALTGLAVGLEGYVLNNPAMMIAGVVVGAAGTLLTQLMAKAMNRPISGVLFKKFGGPSGESEDNVDGSLKPIEASDVAAMMGFADKVIIVPGYGMAVAQAQHKIWELAKLLQDRDVDVKFAIHPVAGRMPGHMNVLLAEAGVPYDIIYDLDEINEEFATANVALIIGANDVVNPVARSNPDSPIYGMPILNADKAENCIVIKRGKGAGFSGIENHLFYQDSTRMLYGDAQEMGSELISAVKSFD